MTPCNLTLASVAKMDGASLLNTSETASALRTNEQTLMAWRARGTGPAFQRIGPRRIFYRVRDVLAFAGEGVAA